MLITAHTVVGFTIGAVSGNPYLAAPLGLAGHYLADGLPHFEVSTFRRPGELKLKPKNWFEFFFVLTDLILALFFLYLFRSLWSPATLIGTLFGVLPDFLDNVFLWSDFLHRLPLLRDLYSFHKRFHWTVRVKDIPLGVLVQCLVVGLCLLVLFFR